MGLATRPDVAGNRRGDVVTVWVGATASATVIEAATRPAGGAWSAPETIDTTHGFVSRPRVAITGTGEASAIWSRPSPDNPVTFGPVEVTVVRTQDDWVEPRPSHDGVCQDGSFFGYGADYKAALKRTSSPWGIRPGTAE